MKVLGYPEGSATDSFLTMIPYPIFRAEGDGEKKKKNFVSTFIALRVQTKI